MKWDLSLVLFFSWISLSAARDSNSKPKIVIVGQTGSGKSTLANVLLGDAPNCKNCTFPICSGQQSCTKKTKYADGKWLGQASDVIVVDTPGFGDTENDDNTLIDEMMAVLKDTLKGANAIVLLVNGQQQRFNASIQQMLREMQALFGEKFWDYTILGVSFWSYGSDSVRQREYTGVTEETFMAEWNRLLSQKFHQNITLQGAFIDSYAKQPWNLEDSKQQAAFQRETQKLWSFATKNDLFMFRTVEDVLKENQDLKNQNKQLHDTISNDIEALKKSTLDNQNNIQNNNKSLEANKASLAQKASLKDFEMNKDEIKMDINLLQQKTSQSEAELKKKVDATDKRVDVTETEIQQTKNTITNEVDTKLKAQEAALNGLKYPLGTILSWVPKPLPATPHQETIPDGWVYCDGGVIPKGVWAGQKTPNLNGEGRFLRGGTAAQVLTPEGHMVQDHTHVDNGHTHADTGHNHPFVTVGGGQLTDKCNRHPDSPWHGNNKQAHPEDCTWTSGPTHYSADIAVDDSDTPYTWYDTDKQPKYMPFNLWGQQSLTTSKSAITSSKTNIGGMATGIHGTETRPTNMRVLWIMKAW